MEENLSLPSQGLGNKNIANISWWRTKFGEEEIQKIKESFFNENISMGSVTEEFEKKIAESLDMPYTLVTTSGSVALLMACIVLGITKEDEVIVPNRTWIATANAPYLLGAKVILVDCEKDRPIIDVDKIEEKITKRTKAIIPVHLNGRNANIKKINEIAKKYGLFVIEDACQAIFSKDQEDFLGTQSDIGCFSLNVTKLISSGGGGILVTKSKKLYEKLKLIRNNGTGNVMIPEYKTLGCNFKFTDIQASMGLVQLSKKQERIFYIKEIYNKYKQAIQSLSSIKLIPVNIENQELPLYVEILCKERQKLIDFLKSKNIHPRISSPNLDCADYLENFNYFPNSNLFAEQGLFLPCGPAQPLENIDYVISVLKEFEQELKKQVNENEKK